MKGLLTCVIVFTILALVVGCDSQSSSVESEPLQIVSSGIGTQLGFASVEGSAKNVGSTILSHPEIRVIFYDDLGNVLDSEVAYGKELVPGETWQFEVVCGSWENKDKVKSYEISIVR